MGDPFSLSKWYLDVGGGAGDTLIAYCARLRWRRLSLCYASVLVPAPVGEPLVCTSLRAVRPPRALVDLLTWRAPALGLSGAWRGPVSAEWRTLWGGETGGVEWRCAQPLAAAQVEFRGRTFRGPGYTEHLRLTAPPWDLPLDELRWGRALFAERSVVWIDWRGAFSTRLVLLDGKPLEGAAVGEDGVTAAGFRLGLGPGAVLRGGLLGRTVLGSIPVLEGLLPRVALSVDERKWSCEATLDADGRTLSAGHAIHEVVRFR